LSIESSDSNYKSNEIQFSKPFEEKKIKFIQKNEKIWLPSSAIADGLEIHRNNVNQIYYNNKDLLEPYTATMKIISAQGTRQKTRVFDKTGFIGICMRSNSKKALPFQKWVLDVVDKIEKKGYYIDKSKPSNLTDLIVDIAENNYAQAIQIRNNERSIEFFKREFEALESKINKIQKERETRPISIQTRDLISRYYQEAKRRTGISSHQFYKRIHRKFKIDSIDKITEKKGLEIIEHLRRNKEYFYENKVRRSFNVE
jgi:prophage antirepressor-like protein